LLVNQLYRRAKERPTNASPLMGASHKEHGNVTPLAQMKHPNDAPAALSDQC
jgi:hypothetical protein